MFDAERSAQITRTRSHGLGDLLRRSAARVPGQTAIIYRGLRQNYAELDETVNRMANAWLATVLAPEGQVRKAGSAGRPALNVETRVEISRRSPPLSCCATAPPSREQIWPGHSPGTIQPGTALPCSSFTAPGTAHGAGTSSASAHRGRLDGSRYRPAERG